MPHPSEHGSPGQPLSADELSSLAETMRALGTPARLRLLFELVHGERTVEQLAAAALLEQSATSHHLRLLRTLRLVRVRRAGRHSYYALHDHHIVELLAAVRHHREHVTPPAPDPLPEPAAEEVPAP